MEVKCVLTTDIKRSVKDPWTPKKKKKVFIQQMNMLIYFSSLSL